MIILSNLSEKSQLPSFFGMAFQLIFILLIFALVLYLSYYFTKFIAGAKIKNMRRANMKVIETISIGFNNLHIVQVNKQYFLLSSSKEGIRMLAELDKDGIQIEDIEPSFDKYFKNKIKETKGGKYEK